uniref:Uncharacterized protein n=1 Tax=Tanacetum cinerariifolium TaxID=118510 RepID=A0A6L2N8Z9_TANCI|nr:hypothetical protein [Tanacetum cinerariifolium]
MENANLFVTVPPNEHCARITQELDELRAILAMIDSRLENISHTHTTIPPPVPFKQLLDDFMNHLMKSDDEEVINELNEYENAWNFYRNRIINSFDGNDLAFPCMIGGLESTRKNLVAIVRDVYVFVGSFTYVTGFVVLEDIREFIVNDMVDVVMGRPSRAGFTIVLAVLVTGVSQS